MSRSQIEVKLMKSALQVTQPWFKTSWGFSSHRDKRWMTKLMTSSTFFFFFSAVRSVINLLISLRSPPWSPGFFSLRVMNPPAGLILPPLHTKQGLDRGDRDPTWWCLGRSLSRHRRMCQSPHRRETSDMLCPRRPPWGRVCAGLSSCTSCKPGWKCRPRLLGTGRTAEGTCTSLPSA